ncbi:MAG: topoisomerase protein [Candidatus Gottesmanbacteria bacterium GW2011_GWA2_42_18]|uniref:Omega-protein n=1 Tax=Candidatus Gottesmanbacteria bacterium GW2011_GWA2_42_18 TaxID=1618442 RepID=A0A0G0ZH20_9BACT|nr:MAG: topoisomerase protein [Candidatus Gottesmanbacteria bacterium GW2011_GWA2_42_18]
MLVIVESPTKAKTLARFLGSDFRIEATMGHIRDLPEKKLGIEITSKDGHFTFKPDYQIIPGRKTKVSELKKMAQNSDTLILATDPDREGEAIAAHFREIIVHDRKISGHKKEFKRIVFHEITESAIKNAIADPHDLDIHLVEAQTARRMLDRLVGYKLSPLLWNKLGKRWLSAGRVQSVAVRLIVDRERGN